MPSLVPDEIEAYAEAHTTAPEPELARLAAETRASRHNAQMLTGAVEGRFLELLVHALGAKRILEFGTFTGYSALSMAAALPPDGELITLDLDPEHIEIARRAFDASPDGSKITLIEGPALDSVARLEGPFDLVFIDADKPNYVNYYEAALPLLSDRGLIVADNTLWSGRVADPSDDSEQTLAIRAFNDHVVADPRVTCVMLSVRDGITLIRRR